MLFSPTAISTVGPSLGCLVSFALISDLSPCQMHFFSFSEFQSCNRQLWMSLINLRGFLTLFQLSYKILRTTLKNPTISIVCHYQIARQLENLDAGERGISEMLEKMDVTFDTTKILKNKL